MEEWKEVKLGEIANIQTGPFGSQLHNKDYVQKGTPIVTVEHLGCRSFSTQNLPCVSDKDKERLNKYVLLAGDIVFSRVGSVDRCSFVSNNEDGWLFSGRCLRVRCNDSINSLYVYYYFCQEVVKQNIRNVAVGATMPSINTKLLSEIHISFPPLPTQQKIANILSSLDDKIEVNRRINENLEAQAQALFKSWFVDFEPFKDGEFVESELGMIPKGWRVDMAENIYEINIGKTPPRKETHWFSNCEDDNVKWVSISDLGTCGTFINNSSEYLIKDAISRFNIIIVPKDTVLLSFKLTVGRVSIADCNLTTNEAIARFLLPKIEYREFSYFTLKNYDYSKLGSTSSIATAVNSKIIKKMKLLFPGEDVICKFNESVKFIFEKIRNNQQEITRLASLRDTLLPKLMSGEVDVNDVKI